MPSLRPRPPTGRPALRARPRSRPLGRWPEHCIILSLRANPLSGTSVGDSGAWIIRDTDILDLTAGHHRKPLVGAGCLPHAILPTPLSNATLLVASDGLFRDASPAAIARIARIARIADLDAAAAALISLVRLPTGRLQDDIAVVLCR